jgi:hypothetical protein
MMFNSPTTIVNNENANHHKPKRMSAASLGGGGYKQQQLIERIKRMALQEAKEYGNRAGSLENKHKRLVY